MKKRAFIMTALLALMACKKIKTENGFPVLTTQNTPASGIRLFNFFGGPVDISVNNIPFTSFDSLNVSGSGSGTLAGAVAFPKGYWPDGGSFTVPTTVLDKKGIARLYIQPRVGVGLTKANSRLHLTVINSQTSQKDYYLLNDGTVKVIDRDATSPVNASDIKVRVINFSAANDYFKLSGPATLTYSDGSMVKNKDGSVLLDKITNDTARRGNISAYVEIPYGAYRFQLFKSGTGYTDQFPPSGAVPHPVNSCSTGAPVISPAASYAGFQAPINTYKPGGTYTFVIVNSLKGYDFVCGAISLNVILSLNSYRVIQENNPSSNITYAQLQPINTLVKRRLKMYIDGALLTDTLNYPSASLSTPLTPGIFPLIVGPHVITVEDSLGVTLASKTKIFNGYDFLTAWICNINGQPDIVFSDNDMSAYSATAVRFLNLSDLPSATFTNDISLLRNFDAFSAAYDLIDSTSTLLSPGGVPMTNPYLYASFYPTSFNGDLTHSPNWFSILRVNQSSAGPPVLVPGLVRQDIPYLPASTFIENPAIPQGPGVYTIALIGNTAALRPSSLSARMIVVKHHQ